MFDCNYGTGSNYSHKQLLKDFRCYQCGEEYCTHREMMVHRKKEHELEDCRAFLKDGKCWYQKKCWWTHLFETEGFLEAPQHQNPPNIRNQHQAGNTPVKSVEISTKKEDLMMKMMNVMNQLMNLQMEH